MLAESERQEILEKAKVFFRDKIAVNHLKNIKKLRKSKEFNINPFLVGYLSAFMSGDSTSESIAKALIYPRALGTSITTSFGTHWQDFIPNVLGSSLPSLVPGIDIEFTDAIDNRKKYCQIKSGPITLNNDDVDTIHKHFSSLRGIARTNRLSVQVDDFVVGVLYGNESNVSQCYKKLRNQYHYTLLVGEDFWYHLTGDQDFYYDLIGAISSVAVEKSVAAVLEQTIQELAQDSEIKEIADSLEIK
jgi:Type II restriction endonuclease EcoO109I